MFGLGTIINTLAVIAGGLLGFFSKRACGKMYRIFS